MENIKSHINTYTIKALSLNCHYQLKEFIISYFKDILKNPIIGVEIIDNCESHESADINLEVIFNTSSANWICNSFIKILYSIKFYNFSLTYYELKYNRLSNNYFLKIKGGD